ncbi:MAG: immune inhibitor A [Candidatus Krumholzibacteriia bacterium]
MRHQRAWSHQPSWPAVAMAATPPGAPPGGGFVVVDDYVLAPERSCKSGAIEIGVICHELGHLLGLPDLYDTQADRAGIGGWGLMGTGAWGGDGKQPARPSWPCAWSRSELGWCRVVDVRQDGDVSLPAVHADDAVLRVRDPRQPGGECWLVENRLRAGYDLSLLESGLLVWHIDQDVIDATRHLNQVNAGPVLGVSLEQADGFPHLSTVGGGRGDRGDPWPGSTGATVFAGTTLPNSHDNGDRFTRVALRGIPGPQTPASFRVEVGVAHLDVTPPEVALLAPRGGEAWTLGDQHTLAWTASDDEQLADVELWLSSDGGLTWPRRLAAGLAGQSAWSGALSSQPGEQLRIRLVATDATGNQATATSGDFALRDRYPPGVVFTCDLSGLQTVTGGQSVLLSWDSADNVAVVAVDIELSCDGGQHWQPTDLVDQPASGAAVTWRVPDLACADATLRAAARDAAGNLGWETGDRFTILGSTTDVPEVARFRVGPCVPNPFNPRAEIRYTAAATDRVRLVVHDLRGRRVRELVDAEVAAGPHAVVWDGRDDAGRDLPSGVYYIRASEGRTQELLKVTLVR